MNLQNLRKSTKPYGAQNGMRAASLEESVGRQGTLGHHPSLRRRRLVFFVPQIVKRRNDELATSSWAILGDFLLCNDGRTREVHKYGPVVASELRKVKFISFIFSCARFCGVRWCARVELT